MSCSVSFDAFSENRDSLSEELTKEENSRWNEFVESIKSKLTVKQVVDGVRAGGSINFDFLLLILTADALAALGLIDNNGLNITAAMLVSPLMGPVMSITFGTIISDRDLMKSGFRALGTGMVISLFFGFIFGLLLGTTEMPWGTTNWPTDEMSGRGNVRALWMGVMWALTSGTGVAVALLQGSAGPLVGVAISASLLPPMVNGGLFWALACTWRMNPNIRMPYLKGEPLDTNFTSSYEFFYTDYLPTEFLINGIVSCCLTFVNIICIFTTAIIVLKVKEVSAPYTASPDLKRFWETDLRSARKFNRESTMRRKGSSIRDKFRFRTYEELNEPRNQQLDAALEQALKEAEEDPTFKNVKRMSYSGNAAGIVTERLAKIAGINIRSNTDDGELNSRNPSHPSSRINSIRNSATNIDFKALDKLVNNLLEQQSQKTATQTRDMESLQILTPKRTSSRLSRLRPTSRSVQSFRFNRGGNEEGSNLVAFQDPHIISSKNTLMPTIMETSNLNTFTNIKKDHINNL